ncbi:TonB-dependent receptor [Flavihumibacter sp. CACIAM 22H1]|uniref:TonB-dependent receptor n=1 Tax=Flavihumibacter sp. CACIAM 22H1 TaxID=1812911 RepID=UPI0007A858A0|nr:TonB-dependent receptor [Flavihumibacter sp. CACIAM 22H1]KYP16607.1 MAG: hypothetical protein A1D16_09340 [Flavihumibacter sp. CACIAM 22H1]
MKKSKDFGASWGHRRKLKTLLLMKCMIALLLATCLQVSARSYSQERLSVSFKNERLESVLREIEAKSSYRFIYSTDKIRTNTPVTFSANELSVEEIVKAILNATDLSWKILPNKTVILLNKNEADLEIGITGTVRDINKEPLAGVSIQVKGTSLISTTDEKGNFSINVPDEKAVLIFTYVNMQVQEVAVGKKTLLNIEMQPINQSMNEVVVVGYGTKTKATLTGAVSVVGKEQLANRPTPNVITSLQGLVPGLVINRGNIGRVGREADNIGIEIRGISSRSNPGVLIIVDGIPQPSSSAFALNNLNPEDVESVTVLKDAQAAIYGSRAAGGVILVTTKMGKTARPTVSVNSNLTINKPGIVRKQANILQAIEMWNESYENDGVQTNFYSHLKPFLTQDINLNEITVAKGPFPDTKDITLSNNDWMDIMWGSATQQQHTLSVSGKSDRSSYWVSVGVIDQNSMLQYGTNYNRKYNTRLKYDFNVTDYLKIRTNVSLQSQKLVEPTDYNTIEDIISNSFAGKAKYTPTGKYYGFGGYLSTIGWAKEGGDREARNTQIRSQVEAVLTPVKNLDITYQLAINRDLFDEFSLRKGFLSYTYDDEVIFNSNLYWGGRDQVTAGYAKTNQLVSNLFANYRWNFGEHNFSVLAGASHEEFENRSFSAYRNGDPFLLSNELSFLGNGAVTEQFNSEARSHSALRSAFSRISYDYKQTYFFEGNFRYDASSKFAPGYRGAPFYGGSVGWMISNEKFMNKFNPFLDMLKLRASYGQLGNQSGIGLYDYIQAIAFGGQYPFGPVNSPLRTLSTNVPGLASPDRSWENLEVKNIGVDIGFFQRRLSGSFDYFVKTNKNMFYSKEFPTILGITPPQINGARMETKGWELALQWRDRINKNLDYFFGFVLSDNKNKVIELADSPIPRYGQNSFIQGYSFGSYFTYQYDGLIQDEAQLNAYKASITSGVPTNIRTGDVMFKDLNGDGKLTPMLYNPKDPTTGGDMVYIGNSNTRYSYSVNLGVNWKGINLSAIFQGVGKWEVMDGNIAAAPFFRNPQAYHYHQTWSIDRVDATYPKMSQNDNINNYNYQTSNAPFKFHNAAYMRLKNLQLGYNLPASLLSKAKLKSVQVFFSGSDLMEWSKIPSGFDPEKPFSIVNTPYPRSYSFGLNITL